MSEYLAAELGKLGIDDEAIVEYCVGLLVDESLDDDDEKHEAIVGYLEAATDADVGGLVREAIGRLAGEQAQSAAASERAAKEALAQAQERERAELQRDAGSGAPEPAAKQLSLEERRQRDKFLKRYGYGDLEVVEKGGETEIVYREASDAPVVIEANNNARIVAEKERAGRENARAAHQKKVERDKDMLEKERIKKDKEKRRTAKREKRRM